jgi:hypothetical protein
MPPADQGIAEFFTTPENFKGRTLSLEGDLSLSSKGDGDFWYVLSNESGSAVARSTNELPEGKVKIVAKVDQTRLGQVYLNVEKATSA